jgi:hypothetical protein
MQDPEPITITPHSGEPVPDDLPGVGPPAVPSGDRAAASESGAKPSIQEAAQPPTDAAAQPWPLAVQPEPALAEPGAPQVPPSIAEILGDFVPDQEEIELPPPPPEVDHERFVTDPQYAAQYLKAQQLYAQLVAEARARKAELEARRANAMFVAQQANRAFAEALAPVAEAIVRNDRAVRELTSLVAAAREYAKRTGDFQALARKDFWAAVAAVAMTRAGVAPVARPPQQPQSPAARPFSSVGSGQSGEQYVLTDEERQLAAQFGLTEEEWIRNIKEASR